jgi:hypothetical protein
MAFMATRFAGASTPEVASTSALVTGPAGIEGCHGLRLHPAGAPRAYSSLQALISWADTETAMLRRLILMLACFAPITLAHAQTPPALKLPAFTQLSSQATESVDISLDSLPLKLAGWLASQAATDPGSADVAALLKGLHGLHVRHYEFASDFAYSQADIDAVRSQLASAGWSQLVQVRNPSKKEDVGVYLAIDKDKDRITGLAIVASEPREFTIVNAVGSLDPSQVDKLRQHFDLHHDAAASANTPLWSMHF